VSDIGRGFQHAARLLLTNGVRRIPADASSRVTRAAIERLAHELVGLAADMRAPAGASQWLVAEFHHTIDRLPQSFEREAAKSDAAADLARDAPPRPAKPRELVQIHVPEDRLPVAAPLAIELTKRRVSVALADYEVATDSQFATALAHGLGHHRGGIVLQTSAFERAYPQMAIPANDRVVILREVEPSETASTLADWARGLRTSGKVH
jgi:hypothetical protein